MKKLRGQAVVLCLFVVFMLSFMSGTVTFSIILTPKSKDANAVEAQHKESAEANLRQTCTWLELAVQDPQYQNPWNVPTKIAYKEFQWNGGKAVCYFTDRRNSLFQLCFDIHDPASVDNARWSIGC